MINKKKKKGRKADKALMVDNMIKLNMDAFNNVEREKNKKLTQNGDKSFKSTGNHLIDLLFMADFFSNNLDEVKIGNTEKEQLFSMYMRDAVLGKGYRDYGRELMKQSGVMPNNVALAGRFDDLWKNPTEDNLKFLLAHVLNGDSLAKKWMPRLQSKKPVDRAMAKAMAKALGINERAYRKLVKNTDTVEYKLSYAVAQGGTPLNELFGKGEYTHPLVDTINFEHVPSLAMTKYMKAFSTREDTKERFAEFIEGVKQGDAKVNVKTANVRNAHKVATTNVSDASDVIAKEIVKNETSGLELDAIVVLDTSGSMSFGYGNMGKPYDNAMAVAHAVATNSTYAKNQVISFSSRPQLMTIKGETLKEQYRSMHTGDMSNTDLGKVFKLLKGLKKYPKYVIVLSDMEFDQGSATSMSDWKKLLQDHGAETQLIWWNFNQTARTSPEFNADGSIFMSGYDITSLMLLPDVMDMDAFIDKLLNDYKNKLVNKY